MEKTQESQFSKSSTNQTKISTRSVFKSLFVTIEKEYGVLTNVSTVALRKLPNKAVKLAVNKGKTFTTRHQLFLFKYFSFSEEFSF